MWRCRNNRVVDVRPKVLEMQLFLLYSISQKLIDSSTSIGSNDVPSNGFDESNQMKSHESLIFESRIDLRSWQSPKNQFRICCLQTRGSSSGGARHEGIVVERETAEERHKGSNFCVKNKEQHLIWKMNANVLQRRVDNVFEPPAPSYRSADEFALRCACVSIIIRHQC